MSLLNTLFLYWTFSEKDELGGLIGKDWVTVVGGGAWDSGDFPEWEPLPNLSTFSLFSSFSLSSLLAVSPRTRIGVRFFWIAYTVKYVEIVPSCLWHLTASNGIWNHKAHLRTRLIYFKASSVHTAKHNSGDREFLPIACHLTGGLQTENWMCPHRTQFLDLLSTFGEFASSKGGCTNKLDTCLFLMTTSHLWEKPDCRTWWRGH